MSGQRGRYARAVYATVSPRVESVAEEHVRQAERVPQQVNAHKHKPDDIHRHKLAGQGPAVRAHDIWADEQMVAVVRGVVQVTADRAEDTARVERGSVCSDAYHANGTSWPHG